MTQSKKKKIPSILKSFLQIRIRIWQQQDPHHIWEQTFPSFHPTVSPLNDLWWAINYSGNAAEEQRKTKIETVNVNMQGAEEAGDSISRRLGW